MTLARGMAGDDVATLQARLAAAGLLGGEPDGQFDDATQAAVVEAQRRAELPQTGVVEDSTWRALGIDSIEPTDLATTEPAPPSRGSLLAVGLLFGGLYWFAHRHEAADFESDEEDEEEEDEDEEDEGGFVPPEDREAAVGDYEDAVTDSLLDEPARISASGRPADCKKAAMRLLRVQALVQRPSERTLYEKTIKKVAADCRGQAKEGAILDAIFEEKARRDDLADELGTELTSGLETETFEKKGKIKRRFVEPGFRKTKLKWTKKSTGSERAEDGGRGKGRKPVRGSHIVRKERGVAVKPYRHTAKKDPRTKRGYTWRRED